MWWLDLGWPPGSHPAALSFPRHPSFLKLIVLLILFLCCGCHQDHDLIALKALMPGTLNYLTSTYNAITNLTRQIYEK